jgi:hypothetical protein
MESGPETASGKPAGSRQPGVRKPAFRSRVSNGRDVLPGVDGRSLIARRYHDICSAIAVDQGGVELLSEARLQLVRRFAAAAVLAEQMEARLANGETIDIAQHALLASTLVRVGQRIGIDRIPRDVSPSLADVLRERDFGNQRTGVVQGDPIDAE